MVRMRAPQRHAVGTRVAIPVEGRTGAIEAFDAESGMYSLAFSDGHRQQVDAVNIDSFVIRTPTAAASASSQASGSSAAVTATGASGGDPNALLGARVVKVVKSYEGKKSVMEGQVSSYFPDVHRYRVLFQDGMYADMAVEETTRAIADATEMAASDRGHEESQKRQRESDADAGARKKPKDSSGSDGSSSTRPISVDENTQEESADVPLNTKKYESRAVAYTIARKILLTILEQNAVQKMRSEKQVGILRNDDIKPKRALEGFVEAGGLRAMQKVLQLWIRTPSTHEGALLALKVLALLPGVTMDALLQSNIAQTLRSIERASETTDLVDLALGDLARWIIRSWKRNVVKRPVTPSPRDLLSQQAAAIHRAGNSGEVQLLAPRPTASPLSPSSAASLSLRGRPSSQQAETARLQALLSKDDDDANADSAATGEEEVVYLPQYNSLGSEDARRPARPIKLIDTLVARLTENIDGVVAHEGEADKDARKDEVDDSIVAPGRTKFAERPQVWLVDQSKPVAELRTTTRDRALSVQTPNGSAPDGVAAPGAKVAEVRLPLPNKLKAPTKSILRVKNMEVTAASQMRWE